MTQGASWLGSFLAHGAWSDAAAWAQVADQLRAAGHSVAAPDLPGHRDDGTPAAEASLQGYARTVAMAAEALGGPAVLVGHSMAGTVISTVAEADPGSVDRLSYLAAFLLPSGQSLFGFTQTSPGFTSSLLGANLRPGDGILDVDRQHAREVFMADAADEIATAATRSLATSHLPMLTDPDGLTAALLDLAG